MLHLGKHWGKAVLFAPIVGIEVAKGNNAIFTLLGVSFSIIFDGEFLFDDGFKRFILFICHFLLSSEFF